jgi:DNA-binding HxlR family transcriptional regulator
VHLEGSRLVEPLDRALALLGDRWSLLVVEALLAGPLRFGEVAAAVPGIAPNILTRRLAHLTRAGLIAATPYSRRPIRLSYGLTATGAELAGVVDQLTSWAARHEGLDAPRHHDACGTPLESRPWCPTCERVVDTDEVSEVSWA